jgi:hypothetical protein
MHHPSRLILAAAALALASPAAAYAQSSPMPSSTAAPAMTMAPMPATSAPMATSAPAAAPTAAPTSAATSAPSSSGNTTNGNGNNANGNSGNGNNRGNGLAKGKVKQIKTGTLTRSQVLYGLTHQLQAAKQLAKMKTIDFDKLRVYKLPSSLKSMVKLSDADAQAITLALLGRGVEVAQTSTSLPTTNGNNSPIQYLRDVLANINVSNALNNLNVLNNSNVNVNVALSNVLNNNKISIGQVVGLYIGGGGIITTITQ